MFVSGAKTKLSISDHRAKRNRKYIKQIIGKKKIMTAKQKTTNVL